MIAAVAVGDFVAGVDVLDGRREDLVPIWWELALGRQECMA